MTSHTSSRRNSASSSASSSKSLIAITSFLHPPCDCLECSPEPEFCEFPTKRKSDEDFDLSRSPLPPSLKLKIDTARFGRDDDLLVYLNTLADLEDTAFDAFVQAACRYHKTTLLAEAACNKLISWSSGIKPETAETITRRLEAEKRKWWEKVTCAKAKPFLEKITEDASLVSMALTGALLSSAVVGAMAKTVTDVRSVLNSSTAENTKDKTATTFDKFTCQGMPKAYTAMLYQRFDQQFMDSESSAHPWDNKLLAQCLDAIQDNVKMAQVCLESQHGSKYAADAKTACLFAFENIQLDLNNGSEGSPSQAAHDSAQKAVTANMNMLSYLIKQLDTASETTALLIDMAQLHAIVTRRRLRCTAIKTRSCRLAAKATAYLMNRTAEKPPSEDKTEQKTSGYNVKKLLEKAQFVQQDSAEAVRRAKIDIQNAAATALTKTHDYKNGTNDTFRGFCKAKKTYRVY